MVIWGIVVGGILLEIINPVKRLPISRYFPKAKKTSTRSVRLKLLKTKDKKKIFIPARRKKMSPLEEKYEWTLTSAENHGSQKVIERHFKVLKGTKNPSSYNSRSTGKKVKIEGRKRYTQTKAKRIHCKLAINYKDILQGKGKWFWNKSQQYKQK